MRAQEAGEVGGDLALGATGELHADDLRLASAAAPAAASRSSSSSPFTARSIGSAFVIAT